MFAARDLVQMGVEARFGTPFWLWVAARGTSITMGFIFTALFLLVRVGLCVDFIPKSR